MKRTETRQVKVGNLEIGHNNHVIIQSMCNIETKKADEVVNKISSLLTDDEELNVCVLLKLLNQKIK